MPDQVLQEITILKQKGKLVRNGDRPIYLLEDGRFAVKHGKSWKTAKTLQGVEAFITKKRKFLPAMQVYYGRDCQSASETPINICGEVAGKLVTLDGTKLKGYGSFYVRDEAIIEKLKDYAKRRSAAIKKFDAEYEKIMRKAVEIRAYNIGELLEKRGIVNDPTAKKK